jgi:hypothetical protein
LGGLAEGEALGIDNVLLGSLSFLGDGGLDRSGDRRDQGYFCGGLRPKVRLISSANIFSAASIASTA